MAGIWSQQAQVLMAECPRQQTGNTLNLPCLSYSTCETDSMPTRLLLRTTHIHKCTKHGCYTGLLVPGTRVHLFIPRGNMP